MQLGNEDLTCMVVEEDRFQRELALKSLEALNCKVVLGAQKGQEALEILASLSEPIHIIFTDLNLQDMNGIEFIQRLIDFNRVRTICLVSNIEENVIRTVEYMIKEQNIPLLPRSTRPISQNQMSLILKSYINIETNKQHNENGSSSIFIEDICNAIDNKLITTQYQPKVTLQNGNWVSAEALSRWEHPEKGSLPASHYIPLLEFHDLLDQLIWQQIHTVIETLKVWHERERQITISVNISKSMLADPRFTEKLSEVMDFYKVECENIILEITEGYSLSQFPTCLATLARLKMKGFTISIDDFGIGHSNFQQLASIPCSELKIDKQFIHNAAQDAQKLTMLETQLSLAKKLNLVSVGEGVESMEEWKLLRHLECDLAQGHFITKALPAEELDDWQLHWKERLLKNKEFFSS